MPITASQKNKILRIVNVFETGTPDGKYDTITLYADGPVRAGVKIRQITYGRSQTTEFGNLKRLLELYIQRGGIYGTQFAPYINKIGGNKPSLHTDASFKQLLRDAARNDHIMRNTQDEFFDIYYYQPALHFFDGNKFTEALSMLVIYDSYIHSGSIPNFLRQKFAERTPSNGGNERKWIEQYVGARHDWLKTHPKEILQKTVYRTNCFKKQITGANWDLAQAVNANGVNVV